MTLYKGTQKVCPIVTVGTTPNLQTKSVNLTNKNGQTFSADNGYDGLSSITVTPSNKTLSITPSKTSQTKTVPTNYSGYGTVTCSAVTSSIDSNIQAGNIKSGVSILGVTGNYTGSGGSGATSLMNMEFSNDYYKLSYNSDSEEYVLTTSTQLEVGSFPFIMTAGMYKDDYTYYFLNNVYSAYTEGYISELPWSSNYDYFPIVADDFSEVYLYDYDSMAEVYTLPRVL